MFFTILVLAAALALESLGSYISVVGLSSKASFTIIVLAIILDFSKIMIATVLYKKWKQIHFLLKSFLIPSLLFLMVVTSSGTYAFLLQEFSKTTAGQEQLTTKIELLNTEKDKLEARKKEIDNQISQLPPSSVLQRKRMTDLFSKELTYINERLVTLDKEIPTATMSLMEGSGHTGTLGSIAKAYGKTPEQISKFLSFLIVLVVDPLAIVLLTVANFLMEQQKKEKKDKLLLQLKGEMPLDEDSLIKQLKTKLHFMRNKSPMELLNVSNYFSDKNNDVGKVPTMLGSYMQLPIIHFISSTKVIEKNKNVGLIEYFAGFNQLTPFNLLKDYTPVHTNKLPVKQLQSLSVFNFIIAEQIKSPVLLIEPLTHSATELLINKQFVHDYVQQAPLYLPPLKDSVHLPILEIFKHSYIQETKVIQLSLDKDIEYSNIPLYSYLSEIKQSSHPIQHNIESLTLTQPINTIKPRIINQQLHLEDKMDLSIKPILQESLILEVEHTTCILSVNNFIDSVESTQPTFSILQKDKIDSLPIINFINYEPTIEEKPIVHKDNLLNKEPIVSRDNPTKIVKKPSPHSSNITENDGFFEPIEIKRFIPSNYEELISYDDDSFWEEEIETQSQSYFKVQLDYEPTTDLRPNSDHSEEQDGFDITILKDKIRF